MQSAAAEKIENNQKPFGLSPKQSAGYFSIAERTIYNWINQGRLVRDKHYLKIGSRVVIVVDDFIDFLRKESSNDNPQP
jgi:hypothetical protein